MKNYLIILILLLILIIGCVKEESPIKKEVLTMGNESVFNITITTVYNNYEFKAGLKTGWGFGCVIKTPDKNILFDTGGDSSTLLGNMEKMGINPKEIDIVVLSHIHGDHVGGLSGFLEKNNKVKVYGPKSFPDSFKEEVNSAGANFIDVAGPMKIENGFYSTGELGTWIKEQSLVVDTDKGLVVVTGCSHPGIVYIIEEVKKQHDKDIFLVIGGWHLGGASDTELKGIINSFREVGVEKVAPCHCSGDRTRELFKKEYGEDYIANGVGKVIEI